MSIEARPAWSMRAVLLAGTIATLLAVLGAAAWLSFEGSEDEAHELFDARLATSARVLEAFLARQVDHATIDSPIVIKLPAEIEASGHDAPSPLGHYYETKIAFQVWNNDRKLLVRSESAPRTPFAPVLAGFSDQTFEDQPWRVFTLRSGQVWIQVAERGDVRAELAQKLASAAAFPLIAGTGVLLVVLALLIGYELAPLDALAKQIEERQPDSVAPVALERAPAEIAPVLAALNGLLVRVRNALERERRFTADAAHELRTPLAALKVHAQNAVRAQTPDERQASLEHMLAGLERTIHLAEQMLALSRASASGDAAQTSVPLRKLVAETIENLRPRIRERALRVDIRCEPKDSDIEVRGDRQKLGSLVSNLLDNAVRYSAPDGRIDVALFRTNSEASLTVTNQGPGIPEDLRERVFESYYRIPGVAASGSGLGLAIVKEVALTHRARVEVSDPVGGQGTSISVRFHIS